jgi:hypothetical protein
MKTTDYRVVHWHEAGKDIFAVHQVFYDDRGQPQRITDKPIDLQTHNLDELKDRHFHIAAAFLQEILPGHLYKTNLTNKPSSVNILNTLFPGRADNDVESQSNKS